jgi:hypothetical protein
MTRKGITIMSKEEDDRAKIMDAISQSIQRLRGIIERDFPPVLAIGELDLLEARLAALRQC